MPNPTRQEIIDAHDALEILYDLVEVLSFTDSETCLARKHCASVFAALPPRPQPTMADVVWDDEKHFLAEAKTKNGPLVAMIGKRQDQWITCIPIETSPSLLHMRTEFEGYLTLTGRKYELKEIENV